MTVTASEVAFGRRWCCTWYTALIWHLHRDRHLPIYSCVSIRQV